MYSIKQASIRSGVSVPLIRAWERRYGVVDPKRTASGYRLYDDEAIATLARVRVLTETGWTASEASRAILEGEIIVATPVATTASFDLSSQSAHANRFDLVGRFIESAIEMDVSATGAALDEIFAQGSFEAIADDLLMPALVELGRAWNDDRLDVAAEHAASAAVHRRLAALYEAAAVNSGPRVVVGLPPGSRHELGTLAFAVALRRLGIGVLYIGADVPISSWVHVVRQDRVRVAVVGIVRKADQKAALQVIDALRDESGAPVVAVGGKHARWAEGEKAGVAVLPDRIDDAAVVVARLASGKPVAGGNES